MKITYKLTMLLIFAVSCSNNPPASEMIVTSAPSASQTAQNNKTTSTPIRIIPTSTLLDEVQLTPTPILYTVVLNDTLTGIAIKFNTSLESLLAANPTIENQPLIVGDVLTIPPPETSASTSTITPVPIRISQVNCYENIDDSLLCLCQVENEFAYWIQNLSVQIDLTDQSGKILESRTAYSPLDLLPPGRSTVVSSYFPAIPKGEYQTRGKLISASYLPSPSDLYPTVTLHNTLVEVSWDGISAHVSGEVFLDTDASNTNRIWILAIAFDKDGSVVGFRRWESNEVLLSGESLTFDLMVSSQNSEIDHVELIVEASR